MNLVTWLYLMYFLIVASIWMAGLVVLSAVAWAIYTGWCWLLAWRNERQLAAAKANRRGWRHLKRMGYRPEDLH